MSRTWQIVILILLFLSIAANVGLLWLYTRVPTQVQPLRDELDRQAQELAAARRERDRLDEQARTLAAEKARLEEENARLEDELSSLRDIQDPLEKLDRLEAEVRALRRLVPPRPVERTFVNREQLRAFLEQEFAAQNQKEPLAGRAQVLALLGLLPPDTDLYTLLLELYTEQVVGFYDLDDDRLYVVGQDELGPLERLTFVHEYVHAIQDQLFDLGSQTEAVEDDYDRALALESLAEGDASLAMAQYLMAHPEEISASDLLSGSLGSDSPRLRAAPAVVQAELLFPYESGLRFVLPAYTQRGWSAVDALWADPPQSTEQVLHPERYPEDTPALVSLPRLAGVLGAGWRPAGEDTLGEFLLRQHLALFLDEAEVDDAATGWGGDRYALYVQPERRLACLVLRIAWDSRDEADEFTALYQKYADARYDQEVSGRPVDGLWWDGAPGFYLEQTGKEAWLIWAPDRETAKDVAGEMR